MTVHMNMHVQAHHAAVEPVMQCYAAAQVVAADKDGKMVSVYDGTTQ